MIIIRSITTVFDDNSLKTEIQALSTVLNKNNLERKRKLLESKPGVKRVIFTYEDRERKSS